MKKHWWSYEPESMSMEEREDRVIKLLATALFRMVTEKINDQSNIVEATKGKQEIDSKISTPPIFPGKSGPVPFGFIAFGLDRVANEAEVKVIRQIYEWADIGISSGKIAQFLNETDKESKRVGKWSRTAVWRILKGRENKGVTY